MSFFTCIFVLEPFKNISARWGIFSWTKKHILWGSCFYFVFRNKKICQVIQFLTFLSPIWRSLRSRFAIPKKETRFKSQHGGGYTSQICCLFFCWFPSPKRVLKPSKKNTSENKKVQAQFLEGKKETSKKSMFHHLRLLKTPPSLGRCRLRRWRLQYKISAKNRQRLVGCIYHGTAKNPQKCSWKIHLPLISVIFRPANVSSTNLK